MKKRGGGKERKSKEKRKNKLELNYLLIMSIIANLKNCKNTRQKIFA